MNDRLKDAFDKVHAEEELKARTKRYLSQRAYPNGKAFRGKFFHEKSRYRTGRAGSRRRLTAVLVCFFLLLVGTGSYFSYFTPTSAISLDINPSIELEINRFEKVIFIKGYNEDGQTLASSLDIRFLDYRDALDRILNNKYTERYLEKDSFVSITVSGDGSEEMLTNIASCTESFHADVHCSHSSSEEVSAAHEAGVSFGKYKAYLELKELDETITLEEVEGLSMCHIQRLIEALSDKASSGEESPSEAQPEEEDETESIQPEGQGHCHGHGHHE